MKTEPNEEVNSLYAKIRTNILDNNKVKYYFNLESQ